MDAYLQLGLIALRMFSDRCSTEMLHPLGDRNNTLPDSGCQNREKCETQPTLLPPEKPPLIVTP